MFQGYRCEDPARLVARMCRLRKHVTTALQIDRDNWMTLGDSLLMKAKPDVVEAYSRYLRCLEAYFSMVGGKEQKVRTRDTNTGRYPVVVGDWVRCGVIWGIKMWQYGKWTMIVELPDGTRRRLRRTSSSRLGTRIAKETVWETQGWHPTALNYSFTERGFVV